MWNYKKLDVWNKSIDFVMDIYSLTKKLPESEKFGLISQLQRAAVSVSANIAEGSSRKSDKEKCRYLEIGMGSGFEIETLLRIVEKLYPELKPICSDLNEKISIILKMLVGLKRKTSV